MARGRRHAADVKAATLALVAEGESLGEAARLSGVGKSTAKRWRDEAMAWHADGTLKNYSFEHAVQEMLAAMLETQIAHYRLLRDPDWVRRQDAQGLAILLGVANDKTLRLLYALHNARPGGTGD